MVLKIVVLVCCLVALSSSNPRGGYSFDANDRGFSFAGNNDIWRSDNGRSSVNANTQFSRNFENNLNQVGAGIGYKSPEGSIAANVGHARGFNRDLGYNVGVSGSKNLYTSQDGSATLDAVGSYSRHHGGPSGTSDPQSYGGFEFKKTF